MSKENKSIKTTTENLDKNLEDGFEKCTAKQLNCVSSSVNAKTSKKSSKKSENGSARSSSVNAKPVTRKLIKKEVCNDESGKNAIYHYEIYNTEGELINTQKVISKSKKLSNKYTDENKEIIIETANKYFKENEIKKSSLYRLSFLNSHLKSCSKYILDTVNIKITQRKLKDLIKTEILELDA